MGSSDQVCYTIINSSNDTEQPNEFQLKADLEKGDTKTKIKALKKTIHMILNGEKFPSLLMTIIRFVLPLQNHTIKKLLLIFWEIVPKTTKDGKLIHEMILVYDAYRKDLQHPNEYIRGSTLRFLCKLKEPELLEPLMPSIQSCLEHKHSYVRKNAVLAMFTIYKNFDFLIPNAPEVIGNFLEVEQDMSCKRNAFIMLIYTDQKRALKYLYTCIDQVHTFGDILQLVIVELIYKVCHNNITERSKFIRCIYNLLNSSSSAVRYEAAGTLVMLSSAPAAIKAAASCYIELIIKESDNNVKLIVLDRLMASNDVPIYEKVLQDLVMDILRILATSDLEVQKKTLNIALDLISSKNVEEMVLYLKKEITKTHNVEHEDTDKYRQLLVETLHSCCIRFPDVASTVIPMLLDILSDKNEQVTADVLIFVREAMQLFEPLRPLILSKLIVSFPSINISNIHRDALWILGEYCYTAEDIQSVMACVHHCLGEILIVDYEVQKTSVEDKESDVSKMILVKKLTTADGIYATQSVYNSSIPRLEQKLPLKRYLLDGDFFIGSTLASVLTKLSLKYVECIQDKRKQNVFIAKSMLIMTSIIRLGQSEFPAKIISDDNYERISLCLKVLSNRTPMMINLFTKQCRKSLAAMLIAKHEEKENLKIKGKKSVTTMQVDEPVKFGLLSSKADSSRTEDIFESSLSQAVGIYKKEFGVDLLSSKLNKVTQLTGFSDPVYAEAYVHVNQCDIILDVLIVNQTLDTLQNCTLELATLGELKLVEKPSPIILGPGDYCNIKASIKVTSTENAIIFGNLVYEISGSVRERSVIVLNDIHIGIMDYIGPAVCTEQNFRHMWAEFEWENKVLVNTNLVDLHSYLMHLINFTNMRCLTSDKALSGNCGFMAANLYACSIFGEYVLANVSIEKNPINPKDPITGHIRIRAKSQGMALSLGDKINLSQKSYSQTAGG